jgi:hypothetical protein
MLAQDTTLPQKTKDVVGILLCLLYKAKGETLGKLWILPSQGLSGAHLQMLPHVGENRIVPA